MKNSVRTLIKEKYGNGEVVHAAHNQNNIPNGLKPNKNVDFMTNSPRRLEYSRHNISHDFVRNALDEYAANKMKVCRITSGGVPRKKHTPSIFSSDSELGRTESIMDDDNISIRTTTSSLQGYYF